jgi:hypothetical protein
MDRLRLFIAASPMMGRREPQTKKSDAILTPG